MGKTFDQSLIDTAIIPMSMIDPEDMADSSSEEFTSMRRVQQGCHTELSNREDFPFNKYTKTIAISKGQSSYSLPEGRITKVRIGNGNSISELKYEADISLLGDGTGAPNRYTITYNPNKIKFYPTPDKSYNVSIDYISTKNVILPDGTYSYNIAVGSTLRMPEQYQHLYFDALEYHVLLRKIRKQSDPRYQPTIEAFKDKWQRFLDHSRSVESETIFTI